MTISLQKDQIKEGVENTDGVGMNVVSVDPIPIANQGYIFSKK